MMSVTVGEEVKTAMMSVTVGEEVKTAASIPAIYDTSEDGGSCGNSSGGAAGANRVPMVGFLDLPEEEQKRLRAGNINDSVLIMRNKRATSNPGSSNASSSSSSCYPLSPGSSNAKGGDAAIAYYQQHIMQLQSSSDDSSSNSSSGGGAEGELRMPGQLRGRSSDGSESGKRVQFGAAQVVAVSSAAGAPFAAGDAPAAVTAVEAGTAAAASAVLVNTLMECVQPERGAPANSVLLLGGVDGDSITVDTSELAAGQRHSRGDNTARVDGAQLPGSTS
jgi:hypothetical protein